MDSLEGVGKLIGALVGLVALLTIAWRMGSVVRGWQSVADTLADIKKTLDDFAHRQRGTNQAFELTLARHDMRITAVEQRVDNIRDAA